jgi:hypothetical protein
MNSVLSIDHSEQRIRETAYHLWEKDGRPLGRAEHYWEMARHIAGGSEGQPSTPATKSRRGQAKKASPAKSKKSPVL